MSLLDTVEPDAWLVTATDRNGKVLIRTCFMNEEEARGLMQAAIDKGGYDASNVNSETMSSRSKVESLLSQCRKEARKEVFDEVIAVARQESYIKQSAYVVFERLRRMAEPDKTTMEGEKYP